MIVIHAATTPAGLVTAAQHASLLIAAGVHPRVIMELLGHSTITTTMDIYGHVFPSAGREAADRLDQMFDVAASQ